MYQDLLAIEKEIEKTIRKASENCRKIGYV